jgi:hypothetical protein
LNPGFLEDDWLRVKLRWKGKASESPLVYGDLPSFVNDGIYHGPSFGHKTAVSMYKLRYDGEYRFIEKEKINSLSTQSFKNREKMVGDLRIRAMCPTSDLGGVRWVTSAIPSGRQRRVVFFARAGVEGSAEISACDEYLGFELRNDSRRVWGKGELVLTAIPQAEEGENVMAYELLIPDDCMTQGEPIAIQVTYLADMTPAQNASHRFFEPLPSPNLEDGRLQGFVEVLEERPYLHWEVEKVF